MWLTRTTAPLLYGAALLLVSVLAPPYGVSGSTLSALNLATTALYLGWLAFASLPGFKRRLRERRPGNSVPADFIDPGPDLRDPPLRVASVRRRVRVQRAAGQAVDDA